VSELLPNGIVQQLEAKAQDVRNLIEGREAKRPLIIEFSGCPKAGKTRAISVFELFLRRNGIKVEVFTERASVSPIKAKGHLNFNVWVSCASLQGILECLYKDLDVFILDRGIFDALMWNLWLERTGKVSSDEAERVADFFTMDRWTSLVDVVFVMTCDPKVSIEREYADQLTAKRGTVMQEDTLKQLNDAIETAMKKYARSFRKVSKIDTTNTTTRDGVARITKEALEALTELLDERICAIPRCAIDIAIPESGFLADPVATQAFINSVRRSKVFLPRSEAERDDDLFQPIPCAILRYEERVLLVRRKEPGHSLHDTYAIWAGGHVLQADEDSAIEPDLLLGALRRELAEEVFIKGEYQLNPRPLGLVRTSETGRASRHIGVLFEVGLPSSEVALAMNQKEFRETRGRSMSGRLVEIARVRDFYKEMGDWSRFIVNELWPEQGHLFSNQST
jgi:predicted NUDIX family phosphoesterase